MLLLHILSIGTLILFGACAVTSQPVQNPSTKQSSENDQSGEVIFVPYDVKYVPIEVTGDLAKSTLEKDLLKPIIPLPSIKQLNLQEEDTNKKQVQEEDNLEDKFEITRSKSSSSSEDYVLVPISLLKKLGVEAEDAKGHVLSKRQAPSGFDDDSFVVYRPIIRLRSVSRSRRRVYHRRPALVGYLNDYDDFPTLA